MSGGVRVADGAAPGLVRSETNRTTPTASDIVAQIDFERRRFGRMRRVLLTAGRLLVDASKGFRRKWWMVTLTYRDDVEWRQRDVTRFTDCFRQWAKRRGIKPEYVWCFEAKERLSGDRMGEVRPHYHVLIQLPFGVSMPKPDKQGWWTHGITQATIAQRAVGYLAKYASKAGCSLASFKGARSYGVSGLSTHHRAVLSYWRAPRWARIACGFGDADGTFPESKAELPLCRVRGGFLDPFSGLILRSPTVAKWVGGVLCFFKREEVAA